MRAQELVAALGGRWHGRYGVARCPAHADHGPSVTVAYRAVRRAGIASGSILPAKPGLDRDGPPPTAAAVES